MALNSRNAPLSHYLHYTGPNFPKPRGNCGKPGPQTTQTVHSTHPDTKYCFKMTRISRKLCSTPDDVLCCSRPSFAGKAVL